MHYLEDDIELLEGIPDELKQQCFEMRDLDGRVEKLLADVREESREFFNIINQLTPEERERRCSKIRETYKSIREMSEEKLAIAEYLHLMLEKYQERIAKDLTEFKYELEADTAGVTDGIEKELGESIRSASASRKSVRPVLGNLVEVAEAEHDSGFEDIKPPASLSSIQNSSANMYRMNGHRHPASTSFDERRLGSGEEFLVSVQNNSASAGGQMAVRRPAVASSSSRALLDETSTSQDFVSPKRKLPRLPSGTSPMAFNQSQTSDSFGIRKTSHPSQRYSPAPLSVSLAGSVSGNASRQPGPLRFNYPTSGTLSGVIGRGGVGHGSRPAIGQVPNEIAQKMGTSSSSSSESSHQLHHLVQQAQFAGESVQSESQSSSYGRPVKLTSRVQQMLKDRQIQGHRVGRPAGALYSASSSSSSYSYGQSVRYSGQSNNVGELSEEEGRQLYGEDQQYLEEEADEEDVQALGEEYEEADEDSEDQDNRVWCTCQQKSEGDMVACDNKSCPYEWFHYSCVGITAPPKGKWFCPSCVKKMRRSQSTENH